MADVQFNLGDDQYLPQNRLDDLPSAILDTAFFLSGSDHSYLSNGFDQYNEWVDGGLEYLLNGFQYENVNDGSQQMPCLVQDNEVPLENIRGTLDGADTQAPDNNAPVWQTSVGNPVIAGDYLPIPASAEYGVIHQAQSVEIPSSAEQTSFQERWEQLDAPVVNNAARGAQATAGAKRFPCSRCEKAFTRANDLKRHMAIHNGLLRWYCATCDKGFHQQSNWKQHMDRHENAKFQCRSEGCRKTFNYKSQLSTHITRHHPELRRTSSPESTS